MLHIPSESDYKELIGTPEVFRVSFARESDDVYRPIVHIKLSSLSLKYVVNQDSLNIYNFYDKKWCVWYYWLEFDEGDSDPCIVWSVVCSKLEQKYLSEIFSGKDFNVFLWNEGAACVGGAHVDSDNFSFYENLSCEEFPINYVDISEDSSFFRYAEMFENILETARQEAKALKLEQIQWEFNTMSYVSGRLDHVPMHLLDADEGNQQENLSFWLADDLSISNVFHAPFLPNHKNRRELTDFMIIGDQSIVLIESKTLSVLTKDRLPTRPELSRKLDKWINKAISQLQGAIRSIRNGAVISDKNGNPISCSRDLEIYSIVLTPDLNLIGRLDRNFSDVLTSFERRNGSKLNIVDTTQLFRDAQAANNLCQNIDYIANYGLSPFVAFEGRLIKRNSWCIENGRVDIDVVLR